MFFFKWTRSVLWT